MRRLPADDGRNNAGALDPVSPLLANIFLHYDLLGLARWRRRHARGRVTIVRYADDFVMGFESGIDARRMLADLKERLAEFGLALHLRATSSLHSNGKAAS